MSETQCEQNVETTLLTSFFVREALCALEASVVQEVIRVDSLTAVRHAPEEVAGVINLRGKIVTLLDLGVVLGFGQSVNTRESRVIIVENRNEFLGVLVDRVGEIFEMEAAQEKPLPVNIPQTQARFYRGVCRMGGHVLSLLNHHEILNESRV